MEFFYLVFIDYQLSYEGTSVATLSDQLRWIIFCNRCGLVLYRAQTKSEHGLYFPLSRRFLNAINNTMPLL